MEHIERGEDLEGLIRENELLRLTNKRLNLLCKSIISLCSSKISELFPQAPPFEPILNDLYKLAHNFALYLQQHVSTSLENQHYTFEGKLADQRHTILKLQSKNQQYQCTISEMSLIIQKLEMEIQNKKMDIDSLRHQILKERVDREKAEENEAKWKGRYEYVFQRLQSARNEDRRQTQRHNIDIYS